MSKRFLILTTFLLVTYECYASLPPSEHGSKARKRALQEDDNETVTIASSKKPKITNKHLRELQTTSTQDARRERTAAWAVEQAKYQYTLPDALPISETSETDEMPPPALPISETSETDEMPPPALPISETSETDEMPPSALPINQTVDLTSISRQDTMATTSNGSKIFLFVADPDSIKKLFDRNIFRRGRYTPKRKIYGYCCPRCNLWIFFQPLSDQHLKSSSKTSEKNHTCPNQN